MEPFLGQIQAFGFNFPPRGWAECNGQLLPISNYSALFSLLGTMYGGDGRTTFALPDLRGRVMINDGAGPGLSSYAIGSRSGQEEVTLNVTNLPAHSHSLMASGDPAGTVKTPAGNVLADAGFFDNDFHTNTTSNLVAMSSASIGNTGANIPVYNMQPYLTVNICIALEGVFPSRS